jgi:putative endonuclease
MPALDRVSLRLGTTPARPNTVADPRRCVYILRSTLDPARHYVGLTADVPKRLASHNAGQNLATARLRPWRLLVSLQFSDEHSAIAFERYLKSGSGRAFATRHFPQR